MRRPLAIAFAGLLLRSVAGPAQAVAADAPQDTPLLADFRAICVQSLAEPARADAAAERLGAQLDENIYRHGHAAVLQRWEHAFGGHIVTVVVAQEPLAGDPTKLNTSCMVEDVADAGSSLPGLQTWLAAPLVPAKGDDFTLVIGHPRFVVPAGAASVIVSTVGDQTMISLMRRGAGQAIAATAMPFTQSPMAGCEAAKLRPDAALTEATYSARLKRCLPPGTPEPMVSLALKAAGFRIVPGSRTAVFEGQDTPRQPPGAPPCHRCAGPAEADDLAVTVRWTIDPAGALVTTEVDWKLETTVVVT